MSKLKQPRRFKHIPQRTCIACHQVQAKGTLVRLVRKPDGVFPDLKGKMLGRGAYLHSRLECWKPGLENNLAHALNTMLTEADKQRITQFFEAYPKQD